MTVTDSAAPEKLRDAVDALSGFPLRLALGDAQPELVADAERFFVSPGVPESNPVYQAARARGLRIESMTTLFFDLCPGKIVGVTGSSGKTTTTGLLGQVLSAAGRDAVVGGNIGAPMLDLLPRVTRDTVVVLELSSFQLDIMRRSPHIAVVTNISPNHLDRHGTMERYIAAKHRIVEFQSRDDFAVLNAGDPEVASFEQATPARVCRFGLTLGADGVTVLEETVVLRREDRYEKVMPVQDIPLLGRHNVENVLAATAAAVVLGIPAEDVATAVRAFRPAPHRLETVADHDGVRYVDDSIATSPARAVVALQAISSPVILIAGGRHKNLPWTEFAEAAARNTHALILIGEAADDIDRAVRGYLAAHEAVLTAGAIYHRATLEDAVATATKLARPGDVVLLSPACTSYDMFENFERRGEAFARAAESVYAA